MPVRRAKSKSMQPTVPRHNGHVRLQCRFKSYSSGRIAREYGLSRFLVHGGTSARVPTTSHCTPARARPSRNTRETPHAKERNWRPSKHLQAFNRMPGMNPMNAYINKCQGFFVIPSTCFFSSCFFFLTP